MFQGTIDGQPLISAFDRNREMQIKQAQAARDPVLRAKASVEEQRHDNQVAMAVINTAAQTFRSRCRTAAAKKLRAAAAAETIISEYDSWLKDHQPSPGISIAEAARRLDEMSSYVSEVEARIPDILNKIGKIAAEESREEAIEAGHRRTLGWMAEAQKLNGLGVIRALEINGAVLVLQDGKIGIKGATVDERTRIYVGAHADEIKCILLARETVSLIEE